jgi:hypothetical protein
MSPMTKKWISDTSRDPERQPLPLSGQRDNATGSHLSDDPRGMRTRIIGAVGIGHNLLLTRNLNWPWSLRGQVAPLH